MEAEDQKVLESQSLIHCAMCNQLTNHTVQCIVRGYELSRLVKDHPALKNRMWQTWIIWKCNGCDLLALEMLEAISAFFEGDLTARVEREPTFYPKAGARSILPKQFRKIPNSISRIYSQTVWAFHHNLDILCAVGLRSLIEAICNDKETAKAGASLIEKINSLGKVGIPNNIIRNLHKFRFMGNAAVHELTVPDGDDLRLAIEIVEDILNFIYDLDYKLTLLNNRAKQPGIYIIGQDSDLE